MITSTGNGRVKQLIQWQKKRKARDKDGVFLVEGLRMFVEAPRENVRELYVSESFYQNQEEKLQLDEWKAKLEILSDHVFDHVSDTMTPQGVLLVMEQRKYTLEEMLSNGRGQEEPLLMVLDNLQDPGNLGTILRAGEAAGVTGVILSRDCVDIYNPKTIRSTMGSVYRVPFVIAPDLQDVFAWFKKQGIRSYAAHLKGKGWYDEQSYVGGTAFLIGNEGNGLTDATAGQADCLIRIPMKGQLESLNAGVAAAILMYEASRQRRKEYK